MIKFGVTKRGPKAERALRLEKAHRGWWPFAYTLLSDVERDYEPEDEALLERLYESMAAGSNARKITRRQRFTELDRYIDSEVKHRFSDVRTLRVHDAAASNGITSLELYRLLSRNRAVEMWSTDPFDEIWVVSGVKNGWEVVFDTQATPLQVVGKGMVLSCRCWRSWRYPINHLFEVWTKRALVPAAHNLLTEYLESQGQESKGDETGIKRIRLFHPECLRENDKGRGFHVDKYDVTLPSQRQYHIVRIMNALTPNHLGDASIRKAIKHLLDSLLPGGIFIVGRSPEDSDESTRVTAYQWSGVKVTPLWHLYGGYEWPEFLASYK